MGEYNELTKRLLAEGYTADNHPDYVKLPGGCWGKNPLQNLHGGFEYTSSYRNQMVFKTGCGLFVEGSHFGYGCMWYMGIGWIPENNNPVINCPYRKDACSLRNPVLGGPEGGGLSKLFKCDCHQTDEPYDYEKSYNKVCDDRNREKKRKYDEYAERHGGHVCQWHMRYDEWKGEWVQHYDPMDCAKYCMNMGKTCDLTHEPISKKKGNVFYDVKTSYIRRDGTLFDGEKIVTINKGVRLFDTAKSMTICETVVRTCVAKIKAKEKDKNHAEILINKKKVEIMNIRAERRESRDLMQDLQDIKEGIKVTHASDLEKNDKVEKKECRQKAKQKKIEKLEKKLLEIGYYNLEQYSLDRLHADKWLGMERIDELEVQRLQRLKEEQEKPVQLSLFDM